MEGYMSYRMSEIYAVLYVIYVIGLSSRKHYI